MTALPTARWVTALDRIGPHHPVTALRCSGVLRGDDPDVAGALDALAPLGQTVPDELVPDVLEVVVALRALVSGGAQ